MIIALKCSTYVFARAGLLANETHARDGLYHSLYVCVNVYAVVVVGGNVFAFFLLLECV